MKKQPRARIYWRVGEAPTGRYRSFERRAWPTAYYRGPDMQPAAFISCDDSYRPHAARSGKHAALEIAVLHHNHPTHGSAPWKRLFFAPIPGRTLAQAKTLVQKYLNAHPEYAPKEKAT